MIRVSKYLGIACLLITPLGCEGIYFGEDKASSAPKTNFDYLWREIDEKYALFDVKDVDWYNVYNQYAPFADNARTDGGIFQIMEAMLNRLRDGHVNLESPFYKSFFDIGSLGQDNLDFRIVTDNYITNRTVTGPFIHAMIRINNADIGYIRLSSFASRLSDSQLDFILDVYTFSATRGLILDLRENGGGLLTSVHKLLSRFVDNETLVYYTQVRNGPNHDDFSEKKPSKVIPSDRVRYTSGPVMVLVDRSSYSATSFFALATKAIDNMKLIGDSTGGGLGLPNGGQLPNGWTYRFPVSRSIGIDGNNYENGVPPDIPVNLDLSDRTHDEIIDRAIIAILSGE